MTEPIFLMVAFAFDNGNHYLLRILTHYDVNEHRVNICFRKTWVLKYTEQSQNDLNHVLFCNFYLFFNLTFSDNYQNYHTIQLKDVAFKNSFRFSSVLIIHFLCYFGSIQWSSNFIVLDNFGNSNIQQIIMSWTGHYNICQLCTHSCHT